MFFLYLSAHLQLGTASTFYLSLDGKLSHTHKIFFNNLMRIEQKNQTSFKCGTNDILVQLIGKGTCFSTPVQPLQDSNAYPRKSMDLWVI